MKGDIAGVINLGDQKVCCNGHQGRGAFERSVWETTGRQTFRRANTDLKSPRQLNPEHTRDQALKCHHPLPDEFVSPALSPKLPCAATHKANAIEASRCLDFGGGAKLVYENRVDSGVLPSKLVSFPIRGARRSGEVSDRVASPDRNEFFQWPWGSRRSHLRANYEQTQNWGDVLQNMWLLRGK